MIHNKRENCNSISRVRPKLPSWIRVKTHSGQGRVDTDKLISCLGLNTVCQSAKCPNLAECWHKRTATFMVMGNVCSRNCKFCAVEHGIAEPLMVDEPDRIAEAVKMLNLKYAVITSVTRDDLDDGGAEHFVKIINKVRQVCGENIGIEVLTPDFKGDFSSLKKVIDARPTVFNHNIETVERLSKEIRVTASYQCSMNVLKKAVELSEGNVAVKSGIMVGLGEDDNEVLATIDNLYDAGVRLITIGQYLPPTAQHWPLHRYVHPDKFKEWEEYSYQKGFLNVASGPLVRSSYHAEELAGTKRQ